MFDCPGPKDSNSQNRKINTDLETFLARQFHTGEHKNFVAKKMSGSWVSTGPFGNFFSVQSKFFNKWFFFFSVEEPQSIFDG